VRSGAQTCRAAQSTSGRGPRHARGEEHVFIDTVLTLRYGHGTDRFTRGRRQPPGQLHNSPGHCIHSIHANMHYEHKESTRASAGREASRAGTVALIDLRVPHRQRQRQ